MSDETDATDRYWRVAALLAFAGLAAVAALTYRDYGITWDEEWQNVYGVKLLAFYTSGFTDRAAFDYRDLFWYGGAFDLVAAALNLISPLGEYETRHLLGGLVGLLGVAGAWQLARLLAGERAGFIALALMALTPSLYGHMFNNPKDAPFAWGMLWTTYFICRAVQELPRPRLATLVWLGVALGLTLGTRVAGVVAIAYLAAALVVDAGTRRAGGLPWSPLARESAAIAMRFLPAMAVAYAVMVLVWPWAALSPLNPIRALVYFTDVPWKGSVLVDGEIYSGHDLPASYLPLHLAIKLPEIALVGLVVALAMLAARFGNDRFASISPSRRLCYFVVILSAAFPVLYSVITRPLDFNGIRHFLFVVPPLTVLAAIGLDRLWQKLAEMIPAFRRAIGPVFAVIAGLQVSSMAELHPNEYIYFNQLIGGTRGAAGRFELDYWGNSLAEASRKLGEHLARERSGRPPAGTHWAFICGYPLSALYYLPKNFKFTTKASEAEFFIGTTQHTCDRTIDGKAIVEVKRDGVVLSVVKDRRQVLAVARNRNR